MKLIKKEKRSGTVYYFYQIEHYPDARCRTFEMCYVKNQLELNAKMIPAFRPFWDVTYLGDGTSAMLSSKKKALEWIDEWEEIGCPGPTCPIHKDRVWAEEMPHD